MTTEVDDRWAKINARMITNGKPIMDPKEWARIDTRETFILSGDSIFEKISGNWNVITPHHVGQSTHQFLLIANYEGALYTPGVDSLDKVQAYIAGSTQYVIYRKIL